MKQLRPLCLGAVVAWGMSSLDAGEPAVPAQVKKAMEAVHQELARRGGMGAQLLWKDDAALAHTFPRHVFVVARYRIYPVAKVLPEGLRASNIFAVHDGGTQLLANTETLVKFFQTHGQPVKDAGQARHALASWLALSQEFHQDGMFKFETLTKEFATDDQGTQARGRAIVMQGGNGELSANMVFADGKLKTVKEAAKIKAGPRPICQATRLLDPDPIVRQMAEQDLLIMGRYAIPYLEEQRDRAPPALRAAIERMLERVRAE